jgi:hypothetical protein
MFLRVLLMGVSVLSANAVLIDRTAIVVDRAPILDSDIARDIRITAFLNREPPDFSDSSRKQAASRLIDQELIRQQIRLGGYPIAARTETDQFLSQIQKERFRSDLEFKTALTRYGITQPELHDRTSWQLTVLRFIDTMFRSQVVVSDEDVQQFYALHRAQFESKPLESVRPAIIETITGEKINALFDEWIARMRKSARIVYLEKSLA